MRPSITNGPPSPVLQKPRISSWRITVKVKQPKKRGAAKARFALYQSGMRISDYLKAGGLRRDVNADEAAEYITIKPLPGLNHLFQTAVTGSPREYESLKEGMSPLALKTITDWIRPHLTY